MKNRIIPITILLSIVFSLLSVPAFAAAKTIGYAGINDYGTYCGLYDLAGVNYCANLATRVQYILSNASHDVSYLYTYKNNSATKTALTGTNSNPVTFFIYSGHGYNRASYNYNTFHLAYYGGNYHSDLANTHFNTNVNFSSINASFRHQYVVAYTCNWLTNNGSTTTAANILKTLNGTRLMLGFASQMYVDSREGTLFGNYMESYDIRNAFIYAASYYQPQNSADVIARVAGYNSAANDFITMNYSNAPSYSSSPGSFSVLNTVTIPHN